MFARIAEGAVAREQDRTLARDEVLATDTEDAELLDRVEFDVARGHAVVIPLVLNGTETPCAWSAGKR